VDDGLGSGWLYFRALRNVEGAAKKIKLTILQVMSAFEGKADMAYCSSNIR
jgi:hypothetical protein